ncbi:MAG: hypothetical protein A2314_03890 [Elusimicrobia bacterium RIFOXYB2_FULL_50_12]|nr:MAG: hypothetical protein A2314_03890 [Elusimicrobia bacterium RIFOXYB2_FULL_50_12]
MVEEPGQGDFALKLLSAFAGCLFLCAGFLHFAQAAPLPPYIEDDFILFWPDPMRAYPGIPLDFRFVAYEINNETLAWQLVNAPAGMSISQDGTVEWVPSDSDVGTYTLSVRVSRESGDFIERSWTITVGADDFLFVATTGSDTWSGTINAPFKTIEKAMRSINYGDGKTIYVRDGTYHEHYNWETGGVISPLRNKNFTAQDPVEIRSFPGEKAVLDCDFMGHGLMIHISNHVIIDNIEVQNAMAGERGGIQVDASHHVMVRDCVVHDSHWSYTMNCTGYIVQSSTEIVIDRATGYNNRDLYSTHHNSSNFLVYLDNQPQGNIYILNSRSYDSICGFKVKHAGPGKLIVHNCQSIGEKKPFAIGSSSSSVRYSIAYHGTTGLQAAVSDPNAYSCGSVLFEHNTIVNAPGTGVYFDSGYLQNGSVIRNNIIYNDIAAAGTGESDNRLMGFWIYDSSATQYSLYSDYNVFYGLSANNIIRWGNINYNYSFSRWQSAGKDNNSYFGQPMFADEPNGNLSVPLYSPANFGSGQFAGSCVPGRSYPVVKKEPLGTIQGIPPVPPSGLTIQ